MHCSWAAQYLSHIASSTIQFSLGGMGVCLLHPSTWLNHRSHHLPHIDCMKALVMGANLQSLPHQFSSVPLAVGISRWEGQAGPCRCSRSGSRWGSSAGSGWPNDWIGSLWCWWHAQYTWGWQWLLWKLLRCEHLRPTLTAMEEVSSLPLWPIPLSFLACAGTWLGTVSYEMGNGGITKEHL